MRRKPADPSQSSGNVSPAAMTSLTAPEVPQDEPLWTEDELARYLRRSVSRLQKDRLEGRGVPFVRLGKLIRYVPAIAREYVRASTVRPALEPQEHGTS
jgi:hypothetical protein